MVKVNNKWQIFFCLMMVSCFESKKRGLMLAPDLREIPCTDPNGCPEGADSEKDTDTVRPITNGMSPNTTNVSGITVDTLLKDIVAVSQCATPPCVFADFTEDEGLGCVTVGCGASNETETDFAFFSAVSTDDEKAPLCGSDSMKVSDAGGVKIFCMKKNEPEGEEIIFVGGSNLSVQIVQGGKLCVGVSKLIDGSYMTTVCSVLGAKKINITFKLAE